MSKSSAYDLVELIQRRAGEYLDLLTAKNDEDFERAFDALLGQAVDRLETNKTHFCCLGEEGLTAVLAGALSIPGLSVSQEMHSNGHVDLTIEADHCTPARKKLGGNWSGPIGPTTSS
jgi:hypothetical protein